MAISRLLFKPERMVEGTNSAIKLLYYQIGFLSMFLRLIGRIDVTQMSGRLVSWRLGDGINAIDRIFYIQNL